MIKYLIWKGADINITDGRGETPAMCAAIFFCYENIKALTELGADLNIKTPGGSTLLNYLFDEKIRSYLIGKGAISGLERK